MEPASDATGAMMSMTGLAARPGTAVLPMCSMAPVSQGCRAAASNARSASKRSGQRGS